MIADFNKLEDQTIHPVKSDLDELIEYYESEKQTLTTLLKECVEDHDYLAAQSYSNGIGNVNSILNTLYHFKDPNHDKKKWLLKQKDYWENKSWTAPSFNRLLLT